MWLFGSVVLLGLVSVEVSTGEEKMGQEKVALLFTTHCRLLTATTRHAFSQADFAKYADDANVKIIITHGAITPDSRFGVQRASEERIPVFVNETRDVIGVSADKLKSIFTGTIRDWSELGSSPGRIKLHLHGGELQKKALEAFLEKEGAGASVPNVVPRSYHISYDALASSGARDPDALVIGLRRMRASGLKAVPVDGKAISLDTAESYPLRMPVAVLTRKGVPEAAELQSLLDELKRSP